MSTDQFPRFRNGRQIRVARCAAGLSQGDLADLALTHRVTVNRLEHSAALPRSSGVVDMISLVLLGAPAAPVLDAQGVLHVTVR